IFLRLDDGSYLRRYELVHPVPEPGRIQVERSLVEAIEPSRGNELQVTVDLDRVACIKRLGVERVLAVGVCRGHAWRELAGILVEEVDRPEISRSKGAVDLGVGAVRKYSGVADVDAGLPSELRAEADGMEERPGVDFIDPVGVVERVGAVGRVLIGS